MGVFESLALAVRGTKVEKTFPGVGVLHNENSSLIEPMIVETHFSLHTYVVTKN